MKKSVATKWVKALRSGKYKKGKGQLRCKDSYCCLGVLCDISGQGAWLGDTYYDRLYTDDYFISAKIQQWSGLKSPQGAFKKLHLGTGSLVKLNDNKAKSFRMIANYIEKNWKDL